MGRCEICCLPQPQQQRGLIGRGYMLKHMLCRYQGWRWS
jgi:hypothetical protein